MADEDAKKTGSSVVQSIYDDAVSPALKPLGEAFGTLVQAALQKRTSKIRLRLHEAKERERLDAEAITKKLEARGVPPERIVPPGGRILMPALIGTATLDEDEDIDIRELYRNLLATSMDSETAHRAHPAFPAIVAQLLPDEARILKWLASNGTMYCYYVTVGERKVEDDIWLVGEDAGCDDAADVRERIGNLNRLGLTTWHDQKDWSVRVPDHVARAVGAPGQARADSLVRALEQEDLMGAEWARVAQPDNTALRDFADVIRRSPRALDGVLRHAGLGGGEPTLRRRPSYLTYLGRSFADACVVEPGSVAERVN